MDNLVTPLFSFNGWDLLTFEDAGRTSFMGSYLYLCDVKYTGRDPKGKKFAGFSLASDDLLNDEQGREWLYKNTLIDAIETLSEGDTNE